MEILLKLQGTQLASSPIPAVVPVAAGRLPAPVATPAIAASSAATASASEAAAANSTVAAAAAAAADAAMAASEATNSSVAAAAASPQPLLPPSPAVVGPPHSHQARRGPAHAHAHVRPHHHAHHSGSSPSGVLAVSPGTSGRRYGTRMAAGRHIGGRGGGDGMSGAGSWWLGASGSVRAGGRSLLQDVARPVAGPWATSPCLPACLTASLPPCPRLLVLALPLPSFCRHQGGPALPGPAGRGSHRGGGGGSNRRVN